MKIFVVLRAVQDPAGLAVNRRAQKVFVNRESYRLNPADHNALEAALAAAGEGDQVTAIAYGGAAAEQVLRDALAAGAGRGLWVQDSALQTADAAVLTHVVRGAIEHAGGADMVVLGADVLDADLAQLGPRLAAALDGAFVGEVCALQPMAAGTVEAVVQAEGGYRRVEAEAPVVAAVTRDSNRPRFAPAARIITVYTSVDMVERVTPAELGLGETELTPLTERRGESFPPERELGAVLEGTEAETARRVAEVLRQWT
jgi:electron transfer flavoprotein beta subunit